ncbi:Mechanosensitive ion channel [Desulfurobacterium pacificum]|uniref:Mechanosensitive ion channel n=1 Tax=Desulfurobacterium pacificum TaxID=240166 RepID=A0ABY1NU03_9BACT|nr:mechanosensitive ion channel domain-containing protein [Desulfurobacterium pacificum]SMP17492.1 Mechanosensitive ion channel [Desulfurobacterium pacificum]
MKPEFLFITVIAAFLMTDFLIEIKAKRYTKEQSIVKVFISLIGAFLFSSLTFLIPKAVSDFKTASIIKDILLLSATLYIVRAINVLSPSKGIRKFIPYAVFLLAFLSHVVSLTLKLPPNATIFLTHLNRAFILLGILLILLQLEEKLPPTLNRLLSILTVFLSLLAFLLWETGKLSPDVTFLKKLTVAVFITSVYIFAIRKTDTYLSFIKRKAEEDYNSIKFNVQALLTAIYAVALKKILSTTPPFNSIFQQLKDTYLINNDLIKINIDNVLISIITAVFLFSLLNIGKKLIKFFFPENRRDVEGASAEALIFNLGVLINVIILLSTLGITWKVLLPVAGTLGVGLGFGLQTIMNNYVSGFILLFSKKLKVGDIVELPSISVTTLGKPENSVFGKIEDIGILSTIARTNDGVEISIPNSQFISSPIVNFSYRDPLVRIRIPIGVAYSSDPKTVKQILLSVAEEVDEIRKIPPPTVWFEELGDSALIFTTVVWTDIRKNARIKNVISNFYFKAWYKLKEANIEIPFPQNDVWFRNKLKVEIFKSTSLDSRLT